MMPSVCFPDEPETRVVGLAPRVRRLAAAQSLSALVRGLSPIVDDLAPICWLALETAGPHPRRSLYVLRGSADEARAALGAVVGDAIEADVESADADVMKTGDGDGPPIVFPILLDPLGQGGAEPVGRLIVAPAANASRVEEAVALIARELGAPLRIAGLVCEAERLSTTDSLTGALNRPAFTSALALELARAGRFGYTVAVLLVGVDRFAQVNDTRGREAGDAVLRGVARALAQRVRAVDLVARWDGDVFGVVLCGSTFDGALTAADRLRSAIEATPFPGYEQPIHVTVSVGVGMIAGSIPAALDTAARALAMAKETGRNRVGAVVDNGLPESSLREREWRTVARLAGR